MTGIHCFTNINNVIYGNANSWIPDQTGGFVGFRMDDSNGEYLIEGLCVSRDKTGMYKDRANDKLTFEVTTAHNANADSEWCTVGSIKREGVATELCYSFAQPIKAKALRVITDSSTSWSELSCIDELQIFSPRVCKRTYTGGCDRWQDLHLRQYSGVYSVEQCHKLCSETTECDGFFLPVGSTIQNDLRGICDLYKKGCRRSLDFRWEYYAMDDCYVCPVGELALEDTLKCQLNGYTCTPGDGGKCCDGRQEETRKCVPCDETHQKKPKGTTYTRSGTCKFESLASSENTFCRRTYEGGCIRWQDLALQEYSGVYSVEQCHKLCSETTECDGFFLPKQRSTCDLYKKGCQKSADLRYDFYAMDDCKVCKRTYEGGCDRWQDLRLRQYSEVYSVEHCHKLCSETTECDGFFLTKQRSTCELYKKGCRKSGDLRWDYYAMDDCNGAAFSNLRWNMSQ